MSFSIVVRRTHMYLALFLTPWILMYALAVFGINHRDLFMSKTPPGARFEVETEQTYKAAFSADADPKLIAEQILADLELEGPHGVRHNKETGTYTINRGNPVTPRRITYTPADGKLVVERGHVEPVRFLANLHHRTGYRSEHLISDAWAFSVDLAIIGMIFWALSGLWLWWELKVTRRWGLVSFLVGCGLFAFFVVTI